MGVQVKVKQRERAPVAAPVSASPELPLDQILMSDCIAAMRSLPAKSIDCIFADPP